jgi:hypothetical protein
VAVGDEPELLGEGQSNHKIHPRGRPEEV